ncbi:hypothetical protein H9P43_002063 [Blastocladiella emersonii ATCC 22665]|nr:hypothetical protein H9P43_002063 [Blastocladiella emersonii ATCC 22665]
MTKLALSLQCFVSAPHRSAHAVATVAAAAPPWSPHQPHAALCLGMTYKDGLGATPIPGCDIDARTMSDIAHGMGIENVQTVTDTDAPVTREQILAGLRDMVAQAQPGDTLLFSYAGHGGQKANPNAGEADGLSEFLVASDGPVYDYELREILSGLPEGATMTMGFDCCHSETMLNFDMGSTDDIAGTVVSISAAQDAQVSMGNSSGGAFTAALHEVLQENPGIAWIDAVELINTADGRAQIPTVSTNRPEALYEPAFAPSGSVADDSAVTREFTLGNGLFSAGSAQAEAAAVAETEAELELNEELEAAVHDLHDTVEEELDNQIEGELEPLNDAVADLSSSVDHHLSLVDALHDGVSLDEVPDFMAAFHH